MNTKINQKLLIVVIILVSIASALLVKLAFLPLERTYYKWLLGVE